MRQALSALLVIFFSNSLFAVSADQMKLMIDRSGLKMELTNERGQYIGTARVRSEEWSGDELSHFVVRASKRAMLVHFNESLAEYDGWEYDSFRNKFYAIKDYVRVRELTVREVEKIGGQFVVGITGRLEKWDVGAGREAYRVVFRRDGKFVTWASAFTHLTQGWNSTENGPRYEVRWADGTIANAAELFPQLYDEQGDLNRSAFLCFENYTCPALALRDTRSGSARDNGKFLSVVYGNESAGRCYYHVNSNTAFQPEDSGNLLTHQELRKLKTLCQ